MGSVTLTTLRARARERADMTGSSFVADAATGLDAWINEGCQLLHGKVVEALEEEYISSSANLSIVSGTSTYNLPSGLLKLYGIDAPINGRTRTILPFNRAHRGTQQSRLDGWSEWPRYRMVGTTVHLLPAPTFTATGTVYYAPEFTLLVNAGDTVNFPNGWEAYAVAYAAIQALIKEESDTSALERQMARIEAEIERAKEQRDLAFPKQAVDMDEVNFYEVI